MKKYQYVAENITEYIKDKKLKHGDQLPKVTDLMAIFSVGKSAILQALSLLDQKGIIYKVQGSGIFVRNNSVDSDEYISLVRNTGFSNVVPDIQTMVVSFNLLKQSPDWAQEKGLGAGPCYEVVRLRKRDGKSFVLETSYYSKDKIGYLNEQIAEGSIFGYIRRGLNKEIRFSDKYMEVRKLKADEAKLLNLNEGDPTLEVKEVFYLFDGQIFNVSRLVYNYQNSKFFDQSADELI